MKLLQDKTKRETYMLSKICAMMQRGDLRKNHPLQRASGLWTNEDRDNFIITVILNEDFDPIKICEQLTDNGAILWLIDGLQKMTIIEDFKAGKFALGKTKLNPSQIEYQDIVIGEDGKPMKDEDGDNIHKMVSYDLRGKAYKDLPAILKENFENCPVNYVKHLNCTPEEIARHIVRYNSGRPMVAAQKIVTYMYNVAKYVKKVSSHAFFSDVANFSDPSVKNGTLEKVVCETIMILYFWDNWTKDAKKIGNYLNRNATEEEFKQFESDLDRLYAICTTKTGELFNQKNGLLWFKLFDVFKKSGLEDEKFQNFLEHFDDFKDKKVTVKHEYELVKASGEKTNVVSFEEIDACRSTKDKYVLEDKLYVLETLMNEYLHINIAEVADTTENEMKDNIAQDVENVTVEENNVEARKISDINENDTHEKEGEEPVNVKDSIENNNMEEKEEVDEDGFSKNEMQQIISFVKENAEMEVSSDDVALYDDCIRDVVPITSNVYQNCKTALIALMAYAFNIDKDSEFVEWIDKYYSQHETDVYSCNNRVNYTYMKREFDSYISNENNDNVA